MPSGYTSKLYAGKQSFEDFVWGAARGMGALVTMREAPADAPISERLEPQTAYCDRREREASERLSLLDGLTPAQAQKWADSAHEAVVALHEKEEAESAALRARYEAMLERVDAWQPPTAEHEGLRQFMQQQLKQSIDKDCRSYEREIPHLSGAAWVAQERASAERDRRVAVEERAHEIRITEGRNAWIKALRESLEASDAVQA
jgi:hypothetical protein